ncbi:MAG TPA: hypothetical protein DD435_12055 [Cyanobacteria bacterium UBA8530]|nr:hypothetical protein [Cyanobacteria bacterium UBA8530]
MTDPIKQMNQSSPLVTLAKRKEATEKSQKTESVQPRVGKDELLISQAPSKTEGLDENEIRFLKAGLLPKNYSDLKACLQKEGREAAIELAKKGKSGPYSEAYGDPVLMLETAERAEKNPELMRLFKDIKKGDILVSTWNSDNIISNLTKGPFIHSILCSEDGPPPEFIEAIGLTAGSDDKTADQVRRMSLGETLYDSLTIRLVRPTEGLSETKSKEVVDRAVLYAEKQLGKPYDYAFTNDNKGTGLTDAYYCSELTFLAYSAPEGGNFKMPLSKSTKRDQLLVELQKGIDSLKPHDQAAMMNKAMKFINVLPPPSGEDLVDFVVDQVMPGCQTTEALVKDQKAKDRLKGAISEVMAGKAFTGLDKALKSYQESEKSGAFNGFFGFFKKMSADGAIAKVVLSDCKELLDDSGLGYRDAIQTTKTILSAVLPFTASLSEEVFGAKDKKTQTTNWLFSNFEWLKSKFPDLPLIKDLPSRAKPQVKSDFVSPTDLAWAPLPHHDYNVKKGFPLEPK